MNSTSSLNCITCSLQSNLKSTRCSSLPRKCVHEEIILVNSRMKIPFRVLSTNHMPPRKWTFYKENHRKKRLLPGEVPPAPQAASGEERALAPEEEARGCSPGFAANSLWKLSILLSLSSVRPLSLSVSHMPSERRTPKLRVHRDGLLSAVAVIKTRADFVLIFHTLPRLLFSIPLHSRKHCPVL